MRTENGSAGAEEDQWVVHVLNRLGYGPRAGDMVRSPIPGARVELDRLLGSGDRQRRELGDASPDHGA